MTSSEDWKPYWRKYRKWRTKSEEWRIQQLFSHIYTTHKRKRKHSYREQQALCGLLLFCSPYRKNVVFSWLFRRKSVLSITSASWSRTSTWHGCEQYAVAWRATIVTARTWYITTSLDLCLPHKDDGEWMRSGAVQEVCRNGGIKNLQYKPTRAFADNTSSSIR